MTNEKIISEVLLFIDENKRLRTDGRFIPMHGRQIMRAQIAPEPEIRQALEYLAAAKMIFCPDLSKHRTASAQINGITIEGQRLIEKLHHPISGRVKGLIRKTLSDPSLLIKLIHNLV